MKTTLTMFAATLIGGAAMASEAQALIPFQGRLTDQQGVPYSNDQYSVIFNIYDVPAGGSSLWTERHEKVGIINGMINVFLGSIMPLPGKVDFAKTAYLGITIDSDHNANSYDPEMVPRQLIVTPVYAKNAGALNGADWSAILADGATDPRKGYIAGARLKDKSVTLNKLADGIFGEDDGFKMPAGVIMPFAGPADKIPDGWLLCNGQLLSQTEHPDLFAKIGHSWTPDGCDKSTQFGVPNFTGRTLWGADATVQNKGVGSYLDAGLPNVDFGSITYVQYTGWGAGTAGGGGQNYATPTRTFDMSKNNPIYGNSDTVQPPAACVNFIIKD